MKFTNVRFTVMQAYPLGTTTRGTNYFRVVLGIDGEESLSATLFGKLGNEDVKDVIAHPNLFEGVLETTLWTPDKSHPEKVYTNIVLSKAERINTQQVPQQVPQQAQSATWYPNGYNRNMPPTPPQSQPAAHQSVPVVPQQNVASPPTPPRPEPATKDDTLAALGNFSTEDLLAFIKNRQQAVNG